MQKVHILYMCLISIQCFTFVECSAVLLPLAGTRGEGSPLVACYIQSIHPPAICFEFWKTQ